MIHPRPFGIEILGGHKKNKKQELYARKLKQEARSKPNIRMGLDNMKSPQNTRVYP